jgi:hypothetical protein
MRRLRLPWLAPVLALVITVPAYAATVVTPNIDLNDDDIAICRIVNSATKAITAKVEIMNQEGFTLDEEDVAVSPGGAGRSFFGLPGQAAVHCRFSGSFSKGLVYGSVDVFSDGRSILVAPAK